MSSPPRTLVSVADYHLRAAQLLPKMVYDYYRSGARDEMTLHRNEQQYQRLLLKARVLVDVSQVSLSSRILACPVASPIAVAASAMHKMASPLGEVDTARACGRAGTLMMLSSLSTTSLEEVARAYREAMPAPPVSAETTPLWFQLYVLKDRAFTVSLIRRAEQAGYSALVVTVDAPILGTRESDVRNKFSLPASLSLAHYSSVLDSTLSSGKERGGSGLENFFRDNLDAALVWADIAWIKSVTSLKVVVKGVQCAEDAVLSVQAGADAIIVSNHGARQLDTVPSTIEMLPAIVRAVASAIPVYVDGGIRRGTDVLKALAIGADAVFIGRPVLWGLAVQGELGVAAVLNLLNHELEQALKLTGNPSLATLSLDVFWKPLSLL